MLIDLDQNTLANMTAALEYVCKKIPPHEDCYETRKLIAAAMVASARAGRRSLIHLQEVGLEALAEVTRPEKAGWARLRSRRSRTNRLEP
jgi:hypothetical protein